MLETVSFEQDSEAMPKGAENLVRPKVFRFSLGQFQRGATARILIVGREPLAICDLSIALGFAIPKGFFG